MLGVELLCHACQERIGTRFCRFLAGREDFNVDITVPLHHKRVGGVDIRQLIFRVQKLRYIKLLRVYRYFLYPDAFHLPAQIRIRLLRCHGIGADIRVPHHRLGEHRQYHADDR